MQVFLDEQPVRGLPHTLSVNDAVALCARHAEANGRLVVGVRADGAPLSEFQSVGTVAELRLTTGEPAQLLADALEATVAKVEECRDQQTIAADAIMEGRIEDGTRAMQDVMDGWARLHQALVQTEQFGNGAAPTAMASALAAMDIQMLMSQLAACLRDLKGAVASEDWSAAADVLGVDLLRQCEQWGSRLAAGRDAALRTLRPG
jgi:hypothetical protein